MSENVPNKPEQPAEKIDDGEIYILDGLAALGQQKKILFGVPVVTTVLAVAAAFLMSPIFTSTAVILPPQQQQGSGVAAMLGQLGGLAGAAGSIAGLKNPSDMYVGMLKSRAISDVLIKKFDLQRHYDEETMFETRKELTKKSSISSGKDGMISVIVEDENPKLAAEIANAYISELAGLTQRLAVTEASKRRIFFEAQLKSAKEDLANAEVALQEVQKKTGMLQLDGQVRSIISNIAQVQAQIATREVQLSASRTFATANNPEVLRAEQELRSLREQLAKLQTGGKAGGGNLMVPTSDIPEVGVAYIRRLRDVKYYEAIFEMLAKQFELAKIEESKDSSLIQQLDVAQPAEKKTRPKNILVILGGLVGGLILGVFAAFGRAYYLRSSNSKEAKQRLEEFKASWKN